MRRFGRFVLLVVGIVSGVEVAAAACITEPYTPPVPTLQPVYITDGDLPNGVSRVDAQGDTIRVYADTLYFALADTTFVQATRYGQFTTASEVLTNRRTAPQKYQLTKRDAYTVTMPLPGFIGGVATAFVHDAKWMSVEATPSGSTKKSFWSYRRP